MPLPWQRTFCHCQKMCLAHHPKTNICAKFHDNRSKTEEVVRDARFPPIFSPYAVTMATHFLPLLKNVSCTSTPQDKHLCQISWESVKNWGSSSRRKIAPDRPTDQRHADSYIIQILVYQALRKDSGNYISEEDWHISIFPRGEAPRKNRKIASPPKICNFHYPFEIKAWYICFLYPFYEYSWAF